jgi:hypothetical protein
MEKTQIKPPATKINSPEIIKGVLRRKTVILEVKPLTPERDQKVFLCTLGSGKKLVIKYAHFSEFENQKIAGSAGIKTPGIVGRFLNVVKKVGGEEQILKGWFGQEYLENSESLSRLFDKNRVLFHAALSKSLDLLCRIHNSLPKFKSAKTQQILALTKESLEKQITERLEERILRLLPELNSKALFNKKVQTWTRMLKTFPRKQIVESLSLENNPHVLVRWDYKLDNILVLEEKAGIEAYSIDWALLFEGSPFIDLGFLLPDVEKNQRLNCLKRYLDIQRQENPDFKSMSLKAAVEKTRYAIVFAQLVHASTNAKIILENKANEYTYQALVRHLNMLDKQLDNPDLIL